MTVSQHRVIAVLNLSPHVPDMVKEGRAVVQKMLANAYFPNPTPQLATVSADLDALDKAEAATKTRTKGTVQARNALRAKVITELHELKAYVQQQADANRDIADQIILSSGMSLKKQAVRKKSDFVAKPGPVSGSAHLVVGSAGTRAAYDWQWSADGGKTWQFAEPTIQAKTTIHGLPVATSCQFRYRSITKTGASDWSEVVTLVVK